MQQLDAQATSIHSFVGVLDCFQQFELLQLCPSEPELVANANVPKCETPIVHAGRLTRIDVSR